MDRVAAVRLSTNIRTSNINTLKQTRCETTGRWGREKKESFVDHLAENFGKPNSRSSETTADGQGAMTEFTAAYTDGTQALHLWHKRVYIARVKGPE